MQKCLFYFGDLSYLLKQEYFQDVESYNYFSEFVSNLKSDDLKANDVVKHQYQDLSGNKTSILLSKIINADYVIHIDRPKHLTIKNHNFTEIECNIKSISGVFGLLCISNFISNIEQLIQDMSKEHNGLIFFVNSDEDKLDYRIRTFDVNEEAYCQLCHQYEHDDSFAQRSCSCIHGVILNHYTVYAHEIGLNNERLFVVIS